MCDDLRAAPKEADGAPETEIEVSPTMIEAGYDVLRARIDDWEDGILEERHRLVRDIFKAIYATFRSPRGAD